MRDRIVNVMNAAGPVLLCVLIGFGFLTIMRLPSRAYLSPLMFNNVGNIGLSVSLLAFGSKGLAYGIAYMVVVLTGLFTVAVWLPQGKVSLGGIARKPTIHAVVLAIVLMATDTRLPSLIDHTFSILGGLAIPLMLLMLGTTLAKLKLGAVWPGRRRPVRGCRAKADDDRFGTFQEILSIPVPGAYPEGLSGRLLSIH